MKYMLIGMVWFQSIVGLAFEYEVQLENDLVCVATAKIMPYEEIGLHRDIYPHVVIASKGGVITRLEANGTTTEVEFPIGIAVFREADPCDELHRSVNNSSESIELTIIHLKASR